ncbi:hypothetical protein [Actinospica sp.]|nr:hypothetical protein [Actinospica sp.]
MMQGSSTPLAADKPGADLGISDRREQHPGRTLPRILAGLATLAISRDES